MPNLPKAERALPARDPSRVYLTAARGAAGELRVIDQEGREVAYVRRIIAEMEYDDVGALTLECLDFTTGRPLRVELLDDPRLK